MGSAFLIDDRLVVTAAHVVDGAVSVVIADDDSVHAVDVIAFDPATDLALLEPQTATGGTEFEVAPTVPAPGTPVAVIGHPLGDPLTITTGTASRTDVDLWPNFQVDAAVNPGNSGGPVIDSAGAVIGVVSALDTQAHGIGYAVRSDVLLDMVGRAETIGAPPPAECDRPLGPDEVTEAPDAPTATDVDTAAIDTLAAYFTGINSGDYQLAFDQYSERRRSTTTVDDFAAGLISSFDFGFEVGAIAPTDEGAMVWLEFVSIQSPEYGPDGEACTSWSLDYHLVWEGTRLVIDRASGHGDTSGHTPCS